MNFHDAERLSAYLDGQLSPSEVARLETRLVSDAGLRGLLEQLRQARGILRELPQRRSPRNFTLTPANPKLRAPVPTLVPVFRFASVLASFLFLSALALNGLQPLAARSLAAAPAPTYGDGGAPAEGLAVAGPATEVPLQSFAAIAPTGTANPELTAVAQDRVSAAPPAPPAPVGGVAKSAPPAANTVPGARRGSNAPVPVLWQFLLGSAAVLFGLLAWYLRQSNQRNFRSRWLEK